MKTLARWLLISSLVVPLMAAAEAPKNQQQQPPKTYKQDEVQKAAEEFFGTGAEGLAKVIEKAFKEQGEPMAIIRGEEASGAIGVGLRYGHGRLEYKGGGSSTKVYWQGPSIGFDFGANASKTFVLVYNLPSTDALFQRYPGVEGSLYFVGGFGLHYVQSDKTVLAPVRFGLGWRQGVGVGYMHFSRKKRYNPF
jgi:hypothetical protein